MNNFVKKIIDKYNDCFLSDIKGNYKCNIEFQKDEEDEEDNEDNKGNENEEKILIIKLNLYRSGDELILRFLRKFGDLHEYNEKVSDIIFLARELYKK